jgi:acyl-CoA thioesterase-2
MPPTDIESAWARYPDYSITASPFRGTGRATANGVLLAESADCLIVEETDHRDQVYFPPGDVRWDRLSVTDHHTVCPFKGRASYWSVLDGGPELENVAWAYPDTFEEVATITGYVAFYADRVDIALTEDGPVSRSG